jgi:hypothetical protein
MLEQNVRPNDYQAFMLSQRAPTPVDEEFEGGSKAYDLLVKNVLLMRFQTTMIENVQCNVLLSRPTMA